MKWLHGWVTSEVHHHVPAPILVAVALAASAGFVDAYIFTAVTSVFVANMSGNLIRLGISIGSREPSVAVAAIGALAGFVAGVAGATMLIDRASRRRQRLSSIRVLATEALIVCLLPVLIVLRGLGYVPQPRWADGLVVGPAAFAMGLQGIALRRVGAVAVSTTYGTGALVRLGEKVALAIRKAPRVVEVRRLRTIAVLASILAAYVIGAAAATPLTDSVPAVLLLPGMVTGSVSLAAFLTEDWEQQMRIRVRPRHERHDKTTPH